MNKLKYLLSEHIESSLFYSFIPKSITGVNINTVTGRYIIKDEAAYSAKPRNQLVYRIQFSRISFDKAFANGLLIVEMKDNSLAGKWALLIHKSDNKWVIQKKYFLN